MGDRESRSLRNLVSRLPDCKETQEYTLTVEAQFPKPEPYVFPVIRLATLVEVEPTPRETVARRFVSELLTEWDTLEPILLDTLRSAIASHGTKVTFADDEQPRDISEGGSRVLDTPRFQVTNVQGELGPGIEALEGRVGVALCTSGLSTKCFSRLRPIKANPGSGAPVPKSSVPKVAAQCRAWNKQLTDAVFGWLCDMGRKKSMHFELAPIGELEVSALGIVDHSISEYFQMLRNSSIPAADILKDEEADKKLSLYYKLFADDIACDLSKLKGEASEAIWFSSATAVEVMSGYLEPREVLYLLRGRDGAYQALGVAYDDSVMGNLALKSTNRVSRWISNRM
jgi:hypothetical protein